MPSSCPVHVTIRLRADVPSLRTKRFIKEFRRTLTPVCERGEFRVAHYSLQKGHAHLIVEAKSKEALGRGKWPRRILGC